MKKLTLLIAMLMATSAWAVSEDLTALECIEIDRKSGEHVWIKVFKDAEQTTNSGFNIPHSIILGKSDISLRIFCKSNHLDFDDICDRLEQMGKWI